MLVFELVEAHKCQGCCSGQDGEHTEGAEGRGGLLGHEGEYVGQRKGSKDEECDQGDEGDCIF